MLLRRGDRGPDVEALQANLAQAGFDPGGVDGIYGRGTETAVRALQAAASIREDGVHGPETAAALAAVLSGAGGRPSVDEPVPRDPVVDTTTGGPGPTQGDDELDGHDEDEWVPRDGPTDAPAVPTSFPEYFDNWAGELAARYREPFYLHEASAQRLAWKGRPQPVDLTTRTHLCMHITAVEFGTSSRQRRRWAERISAGEIADGVVDRYRQGVADDDAVAERMALHERFWPVTYHWVALRNGDVLFNNPAERYTYHGNRSNRFALGISIEADLPGREADRRAAHTVVDEHLAETGRAALRHAVRLGREQGAPLTHVTAHRCFSTTRDGDPGEAVWREIVLPVCDELQLTVDYALVDGGTHLPVDWDPDATHDWHDRPRS